VSPVSGDTTKCDVCGRHDSTARDRAVAASQTWAKKSSRPFPHACPPQPRTTPNGGAHVGSNSSITSLGTTSFIERFWSTASGAGSPVIYNSVRLAHSRTCTRCQRCFRDENVGGTRANPRGHHRRNNHLVDRQLATNPTTRSRQRRSPGCRRHHPRSSAVLSLAACNPVSCLGVTSS
jgi:hypothetical protein